MDIKYFCGAFLGTYFFYICPSISDVRIPKGSVVFVRMQNVLLTVANSEHKESAISLWILAIFVALFLEYIPSIYIHPSLLLESEKDQ